MSRSAGWPFAVLSSSRGVNNLAIAPCVTDAGHASRTSRVKRAVGLERTPNQYGIQTPSPAFWGPPCPDATCAFHILILSFNLYGNLPNHNNAYVFFGHTGLNWSGGGAEVSNRPQHFAAMPEWTCSSARLMLLRSTTDSIDGPVTAGRSRQASAAPISVSWAAAFWASPSTPVPKFSII